MKSVTDINKEITSKKKVSFAFSWGEGGWRERKEHANTIKV